MDTGSRPNRARGVVVCFGAVLLVAAAVIRGAVAPEEAFQYNILSVIDTAPGEFPTVTYSVTDPTHGQAPYDILSHPAFVAPNGVSRLAVLIGWDTRDYTNAGSGAGNGAALPISIDALARAVPNGDGTFSVTSPTAVPASARGTGVAALEGHPAADLNGDGLFESPVQERSIFRFFPITDATIVPRRVVVDGPRATRSTQRERQDLRGPYSPWSSLATSSSRS